MDVLPLLAPLFLLFELWQLAMSERYLGIKQISRGADPRTLGLREWTAFLWSASLFVYWFWMLLLCFTQAGRIQGIGLLIVSLIGFTARRGAELKWVLVTLTFEGAIRIGLLISLIGQLWWHHRH